MMWQTIKTAIVKLVTPKTPLEYAVSELREAEMNRLQNLTVKEYATGMVAYRDAQIVRLRQFIAKSQENQ